MTFKEKFTGTGVALITPFKDNGKIHYNDLQKIINFQIDNNVDYLVSLGTTGESVTLSKEERKELIKITYEIINKRVPLIIGIGGNDTASVMKDLKLMPLEQADAIMSVTPYYNKPTQEGLFKHYKSLAQVSPIPIILYNVPARTGVNIAPQTVIKLATEVENVGGIKEASGNLQQCITILNNVPKDFLVVTGDDHVIIPSIATGMDGVISVVGNAFPKEIGQIVQHIFKNKLPNAQKIQKQLYPAIDLCFIENNPSGIKAFMYELGLCDNVLRSPLIPLSSNYHEQVKAFVKNYQQDKN